ncbi:hypothetical protein GQR58_025056 [Nymphon striatum]|nr:hypothetical protein GQR58_025056 [Nymphon striatum]
MKKYLSYISILGILLFFSCNRSGEKKNVEHNADFILNDGHVHIMSPNLIEDWKNLGIPFSKPDYKYSNIDTILNNNGADHIKLIGMGYVYGNPEFYQGNEEYVKVKMENDFLFESAKKHKIKTRPFFAVDPLKDYAIEEIERCLQINDSSGLKLHFSSSQVYLTEPEHLKKIQSIFKIASENNVPVLLHFDNWHPKFGRPDVEILADQILKNLEPINLTIAHFGTSGGFNQKTKNILETFIELFEKDRIPKRHKILFDISAVALDKDSEGVKKLTEDEFKELKIYCDKIGYDKIIFGTDYPLYNSKEYFDILKTKLNLSKSELQEIVD